MNYIPKVIYIATKNIDRFENISRSLKLVFKGVELFKIDDSLPGCEETGVNSKENAELKAKYYFKFTKENTLAEDDSVYFDDLPNFEQPKHMAKRRIESARNKTDYWNCFFDKHNLRSGRIVKHFCLLKKNGQVKYCHVEVPFTILRPEKTQELVNSLNNFIIPKGFNKTFSEMSHKNKQRFSRLYIVPNLIKLFNN